MCHHRGVCHVKAGKQTRLDVPELKRDWRWSCRRRCPSSCRFPEQSSNRPAEHNVERSVSDFRVTAFGKQPKSGGRLGGGSGRGGGALCLPPFLLRRLNAARDVVVSDVVAVPTRLMKHRMTRGPGRRFLGGILAAVVRSGGAELAVEVSHGTLDRDETWHVHSAPVDFGGGPGQRLFPEQAEHAASLAHLTAVANAVLLVTRCDDAGEARRGNQRDPSVRRRRKAHAHR